MSRITSLSVLLPCCIMFLLAAAPQSLGQSLSDLRRENDQLRERVAQLEAQIESQAQELDTKDKQVEAYRMVIERMKERIETLEAGGGGDTPATSTPATPSEPLPEDPYACPDSMLVELQRVYAEAMQGRSWSNNQERDRYIRDVSRWARQTGARYRRTVEWSIEVLDVTEISESNGRMMELQFNVLNPDTGAALGEPVTVEMSSRYLRRVMDDRDQTRWSLRALFAAEPIINNQRDEEGILNTPPFIGPFAEFDFELKPQSIVPAQP